jgi:hypothetical protein
MANLFSFTQKDAANHALSRESVEYVIRESRSTCFRQLGLFLTLVVACGWIAETSSGPAAEVFRVISAVLLLGVLGSAISIYSHFKGARMVRSRAQEEIELGTEPEHFWYVYRGVFPMAWK